MATIVSNKPDEYFCQLLRSNAEHLKRLIVFDLRELRRRGRKHNERQIARLEHYLHQTNRVLNQTGEALPEEEIVPTPS